MYRWHHITACLTFIAFFVPYGFVKSDFSDHDCFKVSEILEELNVRGTPLSISADADQYCKELRHLLACIGDQY